MFQDDLKLMQSQHGAGARRQRVKGGKDHFVFHNDAPRFMTKPLHWAFRFESIRPNTEHAHYKQL